MLRRVVLTGVVLLAIGLTANAQLSPQAQRAQDVQLNTITTAVPFLMIAPDSRSGGMGDVGVAISPDANSIHWNASKLAFAEKELEVSLSYSPWLRKLVGDMSLAYLSGYRRLNKMQTIGVALRYFSLGNITFTDNNGNTLRDFKPAEYSVDVAFAQKLSEKFSGGITARYINSNLTGSTNVGGADSKPGRSVAVDISMYYVSDKLDMGGKDATLSFGTNISNIGAKMSYTNTQQRDFLPANLRLGSSLKLDMDEFNSLTFSLDANKLLVPTPPIYDPEDENVILAGKDPDVGVATAVVQSFYDAPGNIEVDSYGNVLVEKGSVFKEEMREISIASGVEYWYDNQFAVRFGYFYEHYTKGNRQFLTLGAGLKFNVFAMDVSYLISTTQNNPLADTLRFTLRLEFAELNKASSDDEEEY